MYPRCAAFKRLDQTAPRREMVVAGIEMLREGTILFADGYGLGWDEKPIKPASGTDQRARLPPNERLGQSD
jgi:hypothetical protein